eukprot:843263-Pelagomonas_calceolata.AAC.2
MMCEYRLVLLVIKWPHDVDARGSRPDHLPVPRSKRPENGGEGLAKFGLSEVPGDLDWEGGWQAGQALLRLDNLCCCLSWRALGTSQANITDDVEDQRLELLARLTVLSVSEVCCEDRDPFHDGSAFGARVQDPMVRMTVRPGVMVCIRGGCCGSGAVNCWFCGKMCIAYYAVLCALDPWTGCRGFAGRENS